MLNATNRDFFLKMNEWYQKKRPFFFLIDFEGKTPEIFRLSEMASQDVFFAMPGWSNAENPILPSKKLEWKKFPIPFDEYKIQFDKVKKGIHAGDSYLVNLTCSTPVETNFGLKELFDAGQAKYKLYFKNRFVHFSPEPFVRIENGKISSYPMKGTIDANLENAEALLLENEKEFREQVTIVDLIRNDLSQVADKVQVEKFRYVEKLVTNQKILLTNSSEITGMVKPEYQDAPGSLFEKLLPAGSISGAPKKKTLEIIATAETHQRGYYTGIWGVFDGQNIDSCVIIRYLEKTENGLVFKSGGGITSKSDVHSEYQEMLDKVYLPIVQL